MGKRRFRTYSQYKKLTKKSSVSSLSKDEPKGIKGLKFRNPSFKFGKTGQRLKTTSGGDKKLSAKENRRRRRRRDDDDDDDDRSRPLPNQFGALPPKTGAKSLTAQQDLDRRRNKRPSTDGGQPARPGQDPFQPAEDPFQPAEDPFQPAEDPFQPAAVRPSGTTLRPRTMLVDNLGNEVPLQALTGGGFQQQVIGTGGRPIRPESLGPGVGPMAPGRLRIRQGTPTAAAQFDEFGNITSFGPQNRPTQPTGVQDLVTMASQPGVSPRQQAQLLEVGLNREKAAGTFQVRRAQHGAMVDEQGNLIALGQTSPSGDLINVGVRGYDPGAYVRIVTDPRGRVIDKQIGGRARLFGADGRPLYPDLTMPKDNRTFVDSQPEQQQTRGGGGGGGGGGGRRWGGFRMGKLGGGGGGGRGGRVSTPFSRGGPVRQQQQLAAAQQQFRPFSGSRTQPPARPTAGSQTRVRQNQMAQQGIVSWRI